MPLCCTEVPATPTQRLLHVKWHICQCSAAKGNRLPRRHQTMLSAGSCTASGSGDAGTATDSRARGGCACGAVRHQGDLPNRHPRPTNPAPHTEVHIGIARPAGAPARQFFSERRLGTQATSPLAIKALPPPKRGAGSYKKKGGGVHSMPTALGHVPLGMRGSVSGFLDGAFS